MNFTRERQQIMLSILLCVLVGFQLAHDITVKVLVLFDITTLDVFSQLLIGGIYLVVIGASVFVGATIAHSLGLTNSRLQITTYLLEELSYRYKKSVFINLDSRTLAHVLSIFEGAIGEWSITYWDSGTMVCETFLSNRVGFDHTLAFPPRVIIIKHEQPTGLARLFTLKPLDRAIVIYSAGNEEKRKNSEDPLAV